MNFENSKLFKELACITPPSEVTDSPSSDVARALHSLCSGVPCYNDSIDYADYELPRRICHVHKAMGHVCYCYRGAPMAPMKSKYQCMVHCTPWTIDDSDDDEEEYLLNLHEDNSKLEIAMLCFKRENQELNDEMSTLNEENHRLKNLVEELKVESRVFYGQVLEINKLLENAKNLSDVLI